MNIAAGNESYSIWYLNTCIGVKKGVYKMKLSKIVFSFTSMKQQQIANAAADRSTHCNDIWVNALQDCAMVFVGF